MNFLDIQNDGLHMGINPYDKEIKFWDNIMDEYKHQISQSKYK